MERIIEEFQDEAGGNKSELSYLMLIEDKLTDILEFAKDDFKSNFIVILGFLGLAHGILSNKIEKISKHSLM